MQFKKYFAFTLALGLFVGLNAEEVSAPVANKAETFFQKTSKNVNSFVNAHPYASAGIVGVTVAPVAILAGWILKGTEWGLNKPASTKLFEKIYNNEFTTALNVLNKLNADSTDLYLDETTKNVYDKEQKDKDNKVITKKIEAKDVTVDNKAALLKTDLNNQIKEQEAKKKDKDGKDAAKEVVDAASKQIDELNAKLANIDNVVKAFNVADKDEKTKKLKDVNGVATKHAYSTLTTNLLAEIQRQEEAAKKTK